MFLLAAGLAQAAHATFFTFGTLLWQKQGLSAAWCGALWAIGVFAEVLLFSFSGRVADRFGAARLIAIGAAASIVRWLVLATEPSLAVLVPLQLLHGITYGATHIGAMHLSMTPSHAISREARRRFMQQSSAGVAMGFTTLIAGYVYASSGALSYVAMAAIATVSLIAALRLVQMWNGGVLVAQFAD